MLEIESFSFQNFLSFGDYPSVVNLSELDQCLIVGQIEDDQGESLLGRSNGAGKSNVIAALQWALFGRTTHVANPGSKIRCWFSEADTWAKIAFKNGDNILRTRKKDGTTEVVYYHSGMEESIVANTLSVLKAQQAKINQVFNLDWDIFSKSVFFSCFDKPWLQMGDQKRKQTFERLFKLDRFAYYVKSASGRAGTDANELEKQKTVVQQNIKSLMEIKSQIEHQRNIALNFESTRDERIKQKHVQLSNFQSQLLNTPDYNLAAVQAVWDEYNKLVNDINSKLNKIEEQRTSKFSELTYAKRRISELTIDIQNWENVSGKICNSCKQVVGENHVYNENNPKVIEINEHQQLIPNHETEINHLDELKQKALSMLDSRKPETSLEVCKSFVQQRTNLNQNINLISQEIASIQNEEAPNAESLSNFSDSLKRLSEELKKAQDEIKVLEDRIVHLEYIRRAYSDRNKIKRNVISQHVPFVNQRLDYYLDVMGLDVKVKITDSLGVESNYWGYEFQSNGEKRRTDVAMMLATFDLHEQLYGRQCNLLVLDEVDGQLDQSGIDSLIQIIRNDLSRRVDTVFIISHKNTMQSVFSSEIKVKKRGNFSILE